VSVLVFKIAKSMELNSLNSNANSVAILRNGSAGELLISVSLAMPSK
jgi:hypothetical protein